MGMSVDPQLEMDFEIEPENPGGEKYSNKSSISHVKIRYVMNCDPFVCV